MKNLLLNETKQEILERINKLNHSSTPLWGKMSVGQMFAHCILPLELALANPKPKSSWLKRFFGRFFKDLVIGPKPFKKNGFTPREFLVTEPKDFLSQKQALISKLNEFVFMNIKDRVHPFFGELTIEEWGKSQYKHIDHHLKQFGV
jgi:hypothetical protein